ncbi:MAG: EamA family transporter [Saprospiraceae bacterium]|nr:EamA family transporter [Saprospiraceae bacterium]
MPKEEQVNYKAWLILAGLSIIWGSSFILIKRGLLVFPPEQVGAMRLGISAIAFFPFLVSQVNRIDWRKLKYLLVVGVTGSGLPAFLFATAQTEISSSLAGILNSLTPLFTLLIGVLVFGSPFSWGKLMGIVLGLAGATSLILLSGSSGVEGNIWYGLLVVIATISYATSGNVVGKYLNKMDSLLIGAASFGIIGIPLMIYLLLGTNFLQIMQTDPGAWEALGYVSILALIGTFAASVVFFKLIQNTNPVFGSTVAYLIPIVALGWGITDGELVSFYHLIGMALILSGVYLSRR